MGYSPDEFVKLWNSYDFLDELVEGMGGNKIYLIRRATQLRKQGFQLQKFGRTGVSLDHTKPCESESRYRDT